MSQAAVKVRAGQIRYTNLLMAPDSAKKIAKICSKSVFSRCFPGNFMVLRTNKAELKVSERLRNANQQKSPTRLPSRSFMTAHWTVARTVAAAALCVPEKPLVASCICLCCSPCTVAVRCRASTHAHELRRHDHGDVRVFAIKGALLQGSQLARVSSGRW